MWIARAVAEEGRCYLGMKTTSLEALRREGRGGPRHAHPYRWRLERGEGQRGIQTTRRTGQFSPRRRPYFPPFLCSLNGGFTASVTGSLAPEQQMTATELMMMLSTTEVTEERKNPSELCRRRRSRSPLPERATTVKATVLGFKVREERACVRWRELTQP